MIKCILVDDERILLNELYTLIEQTGKVQIVGAYQDPFKALKKIKHAKIDAVFLDIEMPKLNGIELAKRIAKISPNIQIVFVTAYEQYALKAFEVSAVHYLLKPITQDKLDEAITRVLRIQQMNTFNRNIEMPTLVKDNSNRIDRISVKDGDSTFIIKITDMLYLKSENRKTIIVTKIGSYRSRIALQTWENKLTDLGFARCHRSYIINTEYISKLIHIIGEYKELTLDYCDVNIPISRQYVNTLKERIGIL